MRKIYLPFLTLALAIPASAQVNSTWGGTWNASNMGVTWDKHYDKDTHTLTESEKGVNQAADWMADLPDNMFVAHVSIPGAHDFATGENNWWTSKDAPSSTGAQSSVTQENITMREQMDRGIRGVDFRPGLYDGKLYCNHGVAATTKQLETAFDDIAAFLDAHPNEFFVVHLFRGNVANKGTDLSYGLTDDDSREQYNALLKALFDDSGKFGKYVVNFRPNLTVREARGKMVFFTRDRIEFVHLDKQARLLNWTQYFDSNNAGKATNELDESLYTKIHMQDISSTDDGPFEDKKEQAKELINFAQAQSTPNDQMAEKGFYKAEWIMNFTSIEDKSKKYLVVMKGGTEGYKSGASQLNPEITDYLSDGRLGNGPLGVFFSDFVLRTTYRGDEIVYNVIANNFTGGDSAPVVRFAIDEQQEWSDVVENPYKGQRFFLRSVGASERANDYQYFGGGANYGAHGVTTPAGHWIEFEGAGTDVYYIRTSFGLMEAKEKGWTNVPMGAYYLDGEGTPMAMKEIYYEGRPVYVFQEENTDYTMTAINYEDNEDWNPYYDRPEFYVDPRSYEEGNPYQMWELIPYDYRITTYLEKKANPERPMDATFLVPSAGFGNADSDFGNYWVIDAPVGKSGSGLFGTVAGSGANAGQNGVGYGAMFRVTATAYSSSSSGLTGKGENKNIFSASTTISNLPNGNYKLYYQYASYNLEIKETINGAETMLETRTPSGLTNTDNTDLVGEAFRDNPDTYARTIDLVVTDNKIDLKFSNDTDVSKAYSFYLDNIQLSYYGSNEDASAYEETIKLDFSNEWNTLILPFDAEVPEGLGLYTIEGIETHPENYAHYLVRKPFESTTIKANTPYLVENPEAPKLADTASDEAKAPRRRAGEADYSKVVEFKGVPVNYKNVYGDENGILYGTIDGTTIDESHYQLDQTAVEHVFNANTESNSVAPHRAYINSNYKMVDQEGNETELTLDLIYFDEPSVTTGVEDVATDEADLTDDTPVDVYNAGGVLLRSKVAKADALTDLPRGIYILTADGKSEKMVK